MAISDFTSFESFSRKMFQPADPSSLAVFRILFGMLMLVDIAEERGGGEIDIKWGDSRECHFPLFPTMPLPSFTNMSLLYGIMFLGALGIMLGLKFRMSCVMFTIPYWYIFLLDKSYWNNHSYLYGLIGLLLCGMSANNLWSLDELINKDRSNKHVPYWNYFLLKFQIFILYFYAGIKKTDLEWMEGYSMSNLSFHWIFNPLKAVMSGDQIDYIIVHLSGFLLDLTAGFLLIWDKTRPLGLTLCTAFHFVNSRLFNIGMFPYLCLATLPLFCEFDWPKKMFFKCGKILARPVKNDLCLYGKGKEKVGFKRKFITGLVALYCCLQGFLPYSHFITKGYNNWTNGLYGYSWDMMIHSWETVMVIVRVVDNGSGQEHFLDPHAWLQNDRWNKHADMTMQYAECLKRNLIQEFHEERSVQGGSKSTPVITDYITSENISIYVDVWCSLNGRFQQRMYNPNYDLLKANWSVFDKPEWLLPLLTEYGNYRTTMADIQRDVYSWSNYSDVLFIADFPGLRLENFVTKDLGNISLTILEGELKYSNELSKAKKILKKGQSTAVPSGMFHEVETISSIPSSYMYTYVNKTKVVRKEPERTNGKKHMKSPFPLLEERQIFLDSISRMFGFIVNAVLNVFFDVPMVKRVRTAG